MFHNNRIWQVEDVESSEELAHKLTSARLCCCNAFRLGGYIFANDANSADGAQEYAVLRPGPRGFQRVGSIAFSGLAPKRALELIQRTIAGESDSDVGIVDAERFQTPEDHEYCGHCR
jgi:hypothetical protein